MHAVVIREHIERASTLRMVDGVATRVVDPDLLVRLVVETCLTASQECNDDTLTPFDQGVRVAGRSIKSKFGI